MSTNASVHEAIVNLEDRLQKGSQNSAATAVRLLKIMTSVVESWDKEHFVEDTSSLTDYELLAKFVIRGAEDSPSSSREKRKVSRRIAARARFIGKINEICGLYKAKQAADIMGVSRQTVHNHIANRKLVAIKEGNDNLIPGFQFDEKGKIPHLEEVIGILKNVSQEAKCSFFLNPIHMKDGSEPLLYEVLKRGAKEEEMEIIKREAKLFLTNDAS
ncbi:helix-turn-helix domain-containing protein [Salinicola sp. DM10]|uniref:helix-turn-helix domain-containing protein n=1 Tax=Salinicola sp. DM10 TaxID=2815721 RepID=UPI001A8DB40B|nr:helix-turn-helix domain-containing protein [Salinicola sp. DM10]MCE3028968.1 helix-turn-helix domain-containing protein [Salinicola sp. DM10]